MSTQSPEVLDMTCSRSDTASISIDAAADISIWLSASSAQAEPSTTNARISLYP